MKRSNPVAKFMHRVVKNSVHKDKTKYARKRKHKWKYDERID